MATTCRSCGWQHPADHNELCSACAAATAALPEDFKARAADIAAALDLGAATAAKRGRHPQFPYVPIIKYATGRTSQLRGLAYSDRAIAVARAQRTIDAERHRIGLEMLLPRFRATREQHGLPRELPKT